MRGDLAAPLLGERLAVVEPRFGATALQVKFGQDALGRAELAAQFVGFPSRRFEIADARRRRLLQRDEAQELPSDLDFARRGRLFGGAQPPFEPDDLDRVLGAQRVAVGDRLRFAERREQAGARFREPASATRDRRRRGQRQQRRDQEPDGGKDRLLDQFRLVAGARWCGNIARPPRSSKEAGGFRTGSRSRGG